MIEAVINGRKKAIGIHLYRDGKIFRRIRILVQKEENQDHNRATIMGIKYALLSIKDKTEPVTLYINAFAQRLKDLGFKSIAQKEPAEELKKSYTSFPSIVTKRFQDHQDHQQVHSLADVALPAPEGVILIN